MVVRRRRVVVVEFKKRQYRPISCRRQFIISLPCPDGWYDTIPMGTRLVLHYE
jgi:hypothetical protein